MTISTYQLNILLFADLIQIWYLGGFVVVDQELLFSFHPMLCMLIASR